MKKWLLLLMLVATATGCDSEPACVVPDGLEPDWIRRLGCEGDYALLSDDRADAVFARTRTINWVIDREDGDRTYFIDTTQWELHYYFAAAYLEKPGLTPVGTHAEFNLLNYRRENRRFLLGKLVRYIDQDLLTLEMSAGDTANADTIVEAFDRVSGALFDGDQLVYRPVSADQEAILEQITGRIPVVRTEEVFLGQGLQPLNPAVGYGTLRFAKIAELAGRPVLPTEIVVLDRVPNDLAMASGVITSELQTPLSHINILSKNRGTPNMAVRGAFDDETLRAFEGTLVRLEVTTQDYTIAAAQPADAQAFWDSLRPSEPLVPALDLSVNSLVDLATVGVTAASSIGAKAANLAEMSRIDVAGVVVRLPVTPLAIPFAPFAAHLTNAGLWPEIDALIADAPGLDPQALQERLFALRWDIYRAPLDPTLRDAVIAEARSRWGETASIRFRSSTNAEDLAEFSGAGLYTSARASVEEGPQAIEDAIKVVWASVWSYPAFVERDFQRVDHRRVHMGVLVHPSFEDELANGVAMTINEFNERRPAYFINTQIGDISVTNPTGQAIPEQILYYTWYEDPEYEVITRSSLLASRPDWPGGNSVLTEPQLTELASFLEVIHAHFNAIDDGPVAVAMDVEFKLGSDGLIAIKQARPLRRK